MKVSGMLLLMLVYWPLQCVFATQLDPQRLRTELTPVGAERAGNQDGSIPRWSVDQMSPEQLHRWLESIAGEEPLLLINQQNLAQYRQWLSAGMLALFARYPDSFAMPIYRSHRTAHQPQWTYDNTARNVADARLAESGNEVERAWSGIPFPIPQSAQEIMWNHQLRWKGVFLNLHLFETTIYENLQRTTLETMIETWIPYYDRKRGLEFDSWHGAYYFSHILGPARLAGGGLLIHDSLQPLHHPRQSWIYLTGERRMRRSPALGYDSPIFNSEGLRVADEIDVYNGALDRYDWTLVGKREMYIPYNNQKMRYNRCDDPSALDAGHLKHYTMRFEKHRVWVVEARLKPQARHLYARRTFYIDEDTWSIAAVDIYDRAGNLWRTTLRFAAYYEAMPGIFSALDAYHDLQAGAYFLQCSAGLDTAFYSEAPPPGYFFPASIRQRLRR